MFLRWYHSGGAGGGEGLGSWSGCLAVLRNWSVGCEL